MKFSENNNALEAQFVFKNFTEAFSFMTEVAFLAEKQNHHPNWSNVYNQVDFRLTTHDAGNTVTEKDRKLAAGIEVIFGKRVIE
jgi:4a-hydroxytetrahydrobiopterin dehydratase